VSVCCCTHLLYLQICLLYPLNLILFRLDSAHLFD
jgi:hypothetical protein